MFHHKKIYLNSVRFVFYYGDHCEQAKLSNCKPVNGIYTRVKRNMLCSLLQGKSKYHQSIFRINFLHVKELQNKKIFACEIIKLPNDELVWFGPWSSCHGFDNCKVQNLL